MAARCGQFQRAASTDRDSRTVSNLRQRVTSAAGQPTSKVRACAVAPERCKPSRFPGAGSGRQTGPGGPVAYEAVGVGLVVVGVGVGVVGVGVGVGCCATESVIWVCGGTVLPADGLSPTTVPGVVPGSAGTMVIL
jgi:hypothetical protein